MPDTVIGINLPDSPDPAAIRQWLTDFQNAGFNVVEIGLDTVPLIIAGDIQHEYVNLLKSLLAEYDLAYSAHIGSGVNVRDSSQIELQRRVLWSSIEVCEQLEMSPLVLHYEERSRDRLVESRFLDVHKELAEAAQKRGVLLCIENIEVELMQPVVDLIRQVDHANLRMAFDTGHAFLAAAYFHGDFLEFLRTAKPWISHLHLSDNAGRFEELRISDRPAYDALAMKNRFTFGRGDIHVPPYWGSIPFDQVFQELADYHGIYLCEFYVSRFKPFLPQIREKIEKGISRFRSPLPPV